MRALTVGLLSIAMGAGACETVNPGYLSYHVEREDYAGRPYHETNLGFGCAGIIQSDELGSIDAQYFKNSYGHHSVSLSTTHGTYSKSFGALETTLALEYGFVHGYKHVAPVLPYVVPKINLRKRGSKSHASVLFLWGMGVAVTFNLEI